MAKKPAGQKKKWWKIPLGIVLVLVCLYLLLLGTNYGFSLSLRHYISTFEPVAYDGDRVIPVYDDALGHYTVTTDRDLKIMMLTDLHIGGGCWSSKNDRKTVYEVITMLQAEKPDIVVLCGDNTFAVPGPMFNGGGTLNNNMAAKDVIALFEHEGVYFTTVFGNHDTEAFGYTNRTRLGKTYEDPKNTYCFFRSEFTDPEDDRPSVTNQAILVKNRDGSARKLLLLMDTNDYIDGSISATMNWQYDTLHPAQVAWAEETVKDISEKAGLPDGELLRTLCYFHIPLGEFETAYRELSANDFNDTPDSEYVEGIWDEKVDPDMGGRIWFGGCHRTDEDPNSLDTFFETLGPDGLDVLEACFCGHDHVNNGVVRYKGVLLGYGYSLDNLAYDDICKFGAQRGCTVFTISGDGSWDYAHKNVYTDYGADTDRFFEVRLDTQLYPDWAPKH